ncbi:glycosyltransferase [Paeniclostridium sordellii]|uniref:glycosyltransferase family 2 protein n=1 Tax=Paraclostridium sordellii TaxID=1505 RepID=UPI0005DCBF2F|nr:glycosyltransferase family 2 protein [Paeniclostridium sordellii]MCQ4697341.1 glycosyltransferase family 2 protein [Paeniclostridium sordellii]MDU2149153.1 glycosyltransferase family 2 protein [Paeniclostridium sordellii]MDU4413673.1 glycosyltransferase family 2 protein [Paeniclostridium sordellii]MRZ30402.1 glycosyltransferase [Paeniclostridium sordellii]CEN83672.1 capsular polysaccharide biosynthsis protein [[Clostridium] sordellii] [Paeniclostridium sordellii]
MVKISVIVPVYNIEDYIEECIDSVLNQSYTKIELVIVDDGSKDKSGKICDFYKEKDNRVKVIHKVNQGLSAARNEGIRHATGDYIMFLDGDDFIAKDCIDEIANLIETKGEADIITGRLVEYYNESRSETYGFELDEKSFESKSGAYVFNYLLKNSPYSPWHSCVTIYNKNYFVNNKFYFTEGITSEDLDLLPRIYMKASKVIPYNRAFYYYRQLRPNSIINTVNSKRFYDIVNILKRYISLFEKIDYNKEFKEVFLSQLANVYASYVAILGYIPKNERQDVVKNMKEIKWILKHTNSAKWNCVSWSIKLFGFSITYSMYKALKEINLFIKNT